MSAAIRAKTAKERARIAIRILLAGYELHRTFDDCFEMGDGTEVLKIVIEKSKTNPRLFERCKKAFAPESIAAALEGRL